MTAMRFLSTFSGMGGFDLGLEQTGWECAGQIEIDKAANRLLEARWPDVRRFHDVTTFTAADAATIGAIDLVCGGFPCQDLSVAGKRAGLAGQRSGLFWELMRIVDLCAPRWLLFENVPGLLSSEEGRDMAVVVGELSKRGYGWAYRVLDSQYFGVAQRRRRVFIVGCLGDGRRAAAVLFEPESCGRHPTPSRTAGEGIAGTLGGGAGSRGWPDDTDRMTFIPALSQSVTQGGRTDGETETFIPVYALQGGGTTSQNSQGSGWKEGISFTLNTTDVHAVAQPLRANRWGGSDSHGDAGNAISRGMSVRRLTPLECLRLQGFPDDWFDSVRLSDSDKYRLCGNAVTVNIIRWLGARMLAGITHVPLQR